MHPILVIALATAAAIPLGLWLRHNLSTLTYRDSDEHSQPAPGPRWWVVWASVLASASLATAAVSSPYPATHLGLLPLAIAGPWLAAVDFDVMRIPNRVLAPTAILTVAAVLAIALSSQSWSGAILSAIGALLSGGVFAGIHFATHGDIGFGDVKLAATIGLALGPLGLGAVWIAMLAGSIAALIWARTSRTSGTMPYGPWLLLGALLGVVAAALRVHM